MTLYKFRSLDEFEFTADIIINSRLYSTEFTNLNDPMEGVFYYEDNLEVSIINQLKEAKLKHKVCALTKIYENPVLWAHYANSFKGICIEVEIDETIWKLHEIRYNSFTPIVDNMDNQEQNTDEWAVSALTRKFEEWEYEEEVRILNSNGSRYIENGIIVKSILFGVHTSEIYKDIIRKIASTSIKLFDTELDQLSQVRKISR